MRTYIASIICALLLVASSSYSQHTAQGGTTPPHLPQGEGEGWYKQKSGTTARLDRVYFFNQDSGWAVGSGVWYKTTNGGNTWEFVPLPEHYSPANMIDFNTAFVIHEKYIKLTTDAGVTWSDTINTGVAHSTAWPLYAFNKDTIFTFSADDEWSLTTDRGKTWVRTRRDIPGVEDVHKIFFENSQVGYITGGIGACQLPPDLLLSGIGKTTDGGKSWNPICTENKIKSPVEDLWGIYARGEFIILVGGNETIAISRNTGVTWDTVSRIPRIEAFFGVTFPTPKIGYIAGSGGTILKTTDAGYSWEEQKTTIRLGVDTNKRIYLSDIFFSDSLRGWAVSWNGHVLHTVNGGMTWVKQNPPLIDELLSTVITIAPNHYEIRYRLPEAQRVTIELYNVSGAIVLPLIENVFQPQGDQRIPIPSTHLASGTYFYRIRTENHQVSGSFIVTK